MIKERKQELIDLGVNVNSIEYMDSGSIKVLFTLGGEELKYQAKFVGVRIYSHEVWEAFKRRFIADLEKNKEDKNKTK